MKYYFVLLCLCGFFVSACSAQSDDSVHIKIQRFDNVLYNYLEGKNARENLSSEYRTFLDLYGKQVIEVGGIDSTGFYERLDKFFSEPTLKSLYKDEQTAFADISIIENELSSAFALLLKEFPALKLPAIYIHVSGLNQNIVVGDSILSLSADKYLGTDYPLYKDFFYDYQRQQMTPDRMVPDYLLGYMMAELPFKGNENILLDRMVYEGKLRYILSRLLPQRQVWEFTGYNKDQYLWCSNNQSRIWKSIIETQHLFNPDYLITAQYLKDAPHTAYMPTESPGRVGIWVGYQIVIAYMKNHPDTSLQDLIGMVDYNEFLKKAKYKP